MAWSTPVAVYMNGSDGGAGLNNAQVFIYQRSSSGAPTLPSATTTYTFGTGALTGLNNGWTQLVPSGSGAIYISSAAASAAGSSDTIGAGEWATPVILIQDGAAGAAGINSATIYLFQRTTTSTPPSLPSATVTYTFSSGVASGVDNGWTQSLPTTGGIYRWITTASALGTSSTDTVGAGEWATPSLLSQDGINGADADVYDITFSPFTLSPAAFSNGHVPSFSGVSTTATLKRNGTDETSSWTVAVGSSSYASTSVSSATISLVGLSDNTDALALHVTLTRTGYPTQSRDLIISKARTLGAPDGLRQFSGTTSFGLAASHTSATVVFGVKMGSNGSISVNADTSGTGAMGAVSTWTGWTTFSTSDWSWYYPNSSGIGSSYSLRFTLAGGSGATPTGITLGSLQSMAGDFFFTYSIAGGPATYSLLLDVTAVDGSGLQTYLGQMWLYASIG